MVPGAAKETVLMGHEEDMGHAVDSERPLQPALTFALGLLVGLVITCPTFLIEEYWHGRPLIDQGGIWWTVPAVVMTLGFLVGGVIVGRQCRRWGSALAGGLLVSAVTVLLLFIADLFRRHLLAQVLTPGVERLWLLSAAGAVLVGAAGGLIGRSRLAPNR
jgi:hypothetical protein